MIAFTFLLWIWRGEQAGLWYFMTVPEDQSGKIKAHALGNPRGSGSVKIEARIGDLTWRTSVFPLNSGGYVLPIKADVPRKAGIAAGEEVTVALGLL